jgi:hypothetical protein
MHAHRHIRSITIAVVAASLAVAACGGDDDGGGDGGSSGDGIAALLRQMPAVERGDDLIQYTYGDLAMATELAGLTRPTSPSSTDDVVAWAVGISGFGSDDEPATVVAPVPEVFGARGVNDMDEFADEIGWSILDVDRFLELSMLPDRFTLIDGTVDTEAVEQAVGPARNDIWSLGEGDDFELGDSRSAASPLGVPIRMTERDGLFAVTPSTDMAGAFFDGDDLGGDDGFVAVAEHLDDADVYGAFLVSMSDDRDGSPFDTVGIGVALDDDGALVVIAYHYADEAAAADAVGDVEDVLDGESLRTGQPWSEIFSSSEVTADGSTVVATLRLADDRSPSIAQQILFAGDSLVNF